MAQAAQQEQPQALDSERRGSRWLHAMPSEEDVREWFDRQPLHDDMDHSRYVSGIVLIAATEKVKIAKVNASGGRYMQEVEQAVFTPYVKVDTRIAYFWDLVRSMNGGTLVGDFVGVIEPVAQRIIEDPQSPYFNAHLPQGFFIYPVRNNNDTVSRYLGCEHRVAIYRSDDWFEKESPRPLLQGIGTKQTAMSRNWADDNAIMKAETGAIGRALGVAGILVVGTGVATAEDMQEQAAGPSGAAGAASAGPTLPDDVAAPDVGGGAPQEAPIEAASVAVAEKPQPETDEELVAYGLELQQEFRTDHPQAFEVFVHWYTEDRKLGNFTELTGPVLRGVVTKLERDLDAAKQEGLA
jgi:hypothetical protein